MIAILFSVYTIVILQFVAALPAQNGQSVVKDELNGLQLTKGDCPPISNCDYIESSQGALRFNKRGNSRFPGKLAEPSRLTSSSVSSNYNEGPQQLNEPLADGADLLNSYINTYQSSPLGQEDEEYNTSTAIFVAQLAQKQEAQKLTAEQRSFLQMLHHYGFPSYINIQRFKFNVWFASLHDKLFQFDATGGAILTLVGFTEETALSILNAYNTAKANAYKVLRLLDNFEFEQATQHVFKKYFQLEDLEQVLTVLANVALHQRKLFAGVRVRDCPYPRYDSDIVATAIQSSSNFLNGFLEINAQLWNQCSSTQQQLTMLHEMTHLTSDTKDVQFQKGDYIEIFYGDRCCQNLNNSTKSPLTLTDEFGNAGMKSVDNADNYAYFVEAMLQQQRSPTIQV